MKIFGIDPGYAIIGYAVIEYKENIKNLITCGVITTKNTCNFPERLEKIFKEILILFEKYSPDIIAIESLYFQNNQKTAMCVSGARGVLILASKIYGKEIFEYTPAQVKFAISGSGKAKKNDIIKGARDILNLDFDPKPDDAADAIAVAICHCNKFILKI